jgi:hypothetical protein
MNRLEAYSTFLFAAIRVHSRFVSFPTLGTPHPVDPVILVRQERRVKLANWKVFVM